MRSKHKMKKPEKLNLVPILDSVFIFIFFLLMSAQFVDVYEIGSSVPMTKTAKNKDMEKDPLNLILEITKNEIIVKTGLRSQNSRTFISEQKKELKDYLGELKKKHPNESTMILKADPKISFQNLIAVIDSTQNQKNGKDQLFPQIVFDNNGVGK
jgi:biopolymer transport protein ExbD